MGEIFFDNLKKIFGRGFFQFSPAKTYLNGYFPMKVPLVRKCNKPVPEQVK